MFHQEPLLIKTVLVGRSQFLHGRGFPELLLRPREVIGEISDVSLREIQADFSCLMLGYEELDLGGKGRDLAKAGRQVNDGDWFLPTSTENSENKTRNEGSHGPA